MFKEALNSLVSRMDDQTVIGVIVMDHQGIALEKVPRDADPMMDAEVLGMEYSVLLKSANKTADMVNAGKVSEVCVLNEKFTTLLRPINAEYFLALFLRPGANTGKGRLLIRTAAARLVKDL